ncbi:MAG: TSUP family transporter [Candidatus Lokiarchaeota archaeon]|nr:TSUP family transporter [Candidatus Lokiarchaeota archaeon]MBD3340728.1 TSUP family transporter [Candidatus Lokiarchaeota archaeon]
MENYFVIFAILALAVLVGSTTGFGDSLIFIPLAAIFLDLYVAIVLMGFWTFALSFFNSIKYRKFFDKSLFKRYLIPGILGVIIGSLLLVIAPVRIVEFCLGVFIIIFVVAKSREYYKIQIGQGSENRIILSSPELRDIPNKILYPGAFTYGFVGGLIGTPGPINIVVLERRGHERESLIGNFSIISIFITSFRLVIYVCYSLFPVDFILMFIIGIAITYGVSKFGHWLTPKIPKNKFKLLILLLLTIIGIRTTIGSTLAILTNGMF